MADLYKTMRNSLAFTLLFIVVFPLAAQANQPVIIYVPEIAGYGFSPSDNFFITGKLRDEVRARNYIAVYSPSLADFQLIGALSSYVSDNKEQTESCVLNIVLKTAAGVIVAEQALIFADLDDMNDQFTLLMFNIFSQSLIKEADRAKLKSWLDKWLYFGAGVFWTPRFYYGTELSSHYANFGAEVSAEIFFHPLLSFETALELTSDVVVQADPEGRDYPYQDLMLEIPLLIKYVLKAHDINLAELYGGFQINTSLFRETIKPSWVSVSTGCLFGIKSEKGFYYIDPRLSVDLRKSDFAVFSFPYHRTALHIGVGYKTGVFSRQQLLKEHFRQLFTGTKL
jgi:hypothetical protein